MAILFREVRIENVYSSPDMLSYLQAEEEAGDEDRVLGDALQVGRCTYTSSKLGPETCSSVLFDKVQVHRKVLLPSIRQPW